jgi:hypothetical protein
MTLEQQNCRMSILEESFKKIPVNRLDKPLNFFLQDNDVDSICYSVTRLSPALKKVNKVCDIIAIFPTVIKMSTTNDVVHIHELLSTNLVELLNETFKPLFSDPQNTNSLEILYQRSNGCTLQNGVITMSFPFNGY